MTRETLRHGILVFESIKLANPPDFAKQEVEDIWYALLKPLPEKDFMVAVDILARTSKFWPTPSEIIDTIPIKTLSASNAWDRVQKQINRCCGAPGILPEFSTAVIIDVVNSMGGLNAIWPKDDIDQICKRREFIKRYNKIVISGRMSLPGGEVKQWGRYKK